MIVAIKATCSHVALIACPHVTKFTCSHGYSSFVLSPIITSQVMSKLPGQLDNEGAPLKLLLIDDNSQIREMTRFYIQDLAAEIRECANGEKAFADYVEFLPDWVLIEVYLKETDGFAIIRQISKFYPQAKIIVLTNHPDEQTRLAASGAGSCAFFGKDDLNALVSFIKKETL